MSILPTVPSCAIPATEKMPAETSSILTTLKPSHPRLIAADDSWERLKTRRRTDATLDAFLKRGEIEARALLEAPPIPYKKDGKRLLHVSRVVLRRVVLLAMQYQLTGDEALARRAAAEMLNVSGFNDWNPSHFLDTAEMTTALALGYDWLYDELDGDTRQKIETAIIEKGLKPGLPDMSWARAENNWNSVCLAGMSLGALAIAERAPQLAADTLQKTRDYNSYGLKVYAPEGVYPEGAMYWGYGTTFEVILLDALHSALGTDWGLSQSPGFLKTADALWQMMGPTGTFFNFADGVERPGIESGPYWFAHHLQRPELVRSETGRLQRYSDLSRPPAPGSEGDRTLPLAALWWPDSPPPVVVVAPPKSWYGPGINPIAAFRSSWGEPGAMYLALKGGKASQSHGHMDSGSFVFESDGVRWACDLGMQSYLELESKGVDLWGRGQNAGRWTVFRLNNFSHNTLTINDRLHNFDGMAEIKQFSSDEQNTGAVVDLSPVFAGQAGRVQRGYAFRSGSHTLIRDEVEGLKAGDKVRFAMLTRGQGTVSADGKTVTLTQDGKALHVQLISAATTKFEIVSAEPPKNDYDEANPRFRLLVANFVAPASGRLDWSVLLQPEKPEMKTAGDPLADTELRNWPMPATSK